MLQSLDLTLEWLPCVPLLSLTSVVWMQSSNYCSVFLLVELKLELAELRLAWLARKGPPVRT